VSTVQVSFGTLTVPPMPPDPEAPAGPVVEPPEATSLPEDPPEAPPDEGSLVLPALELLPALLLLETALLEDPPCPPDPPELRDEEVPPAPPESLLVRLGLAAQAVPTMAMA
jgi:hypothetical protein